MPDVLIRSFRLRIVRKRSLFWGDDPRALARRALAALPRLLAAELDALGVGDDRDVEVSSPVHLSVTGTVASLSAALAGDGSPVLVRQLVAQALEVALATHSEGAQRRAEPAPSVPPRPALGELLPLYIAGELPGRLARMDPGLVEAYHRLLLVERHAGATAPRPVTPPELGQTQRFIEALAVGFAAGKAPVTRASRLRERVLAAVALAAQTGVHPFDPGVRAIVDRLLPSEVGAAPAGATDPARGEALRGGDAAVRPARIGAPRERDEKAAPADARRPARRSVPTERAAPILPLIAAALLTRRGVVSAVAQHLEAVRRPEDLPLWIAALAFKLGPTPVRGWMYSEEVWRQVAAVAGHALISSESMARLADDLHAGWPALARTLLDLLAPGGDALVRVPPRKDRPVDRPIPGPEASVLCLAEPLCPVWIGPRSEEPRAVTDAQAAEGLDETMALLDARPACALARKPEFDRHVTAAAGWAMAHIGRVLWPEDGAPVPLAFARLSTLEVRVRQDEDGISVRVPLGKRHADLSRAGLLEDLHRSPWLDGRSVRFRGA